MAVPEQEAPLALVEPQVVAQPGQVALVVAAAPVPQADSQLHMVPVPVARRVLH
jgi:hypothetical protein